MPIHAMDYMPTDFDGDSSSHFPSRARTNRQTNRRDWTPYPTLAAIQPAWVNIINAQYLTLYNADIHLIYARSCANKNCAVHASSDVLLGLYFSSVLRQFHSAFLGRSSQIIIEKISPTLVNVKTAHPRNGLYIA